MTEADRKRICGLDVDGSTILYYHNLDISAFLLDRIKGLIDAAK